MHRRSSASKGRFGVAEPEGCASICERQSSQRTSNFRSLLSLIQTALKFLDVKNQLFSCSLCALCVRFIWDAIFAIFFHLPHIISYTPYRRQCPFGNFSNFRSAVFPISVRLFFRNFALILCACALPFKVAGLPMEDGIMIARPPLICQPPRRFGYGRGERVEKAEREN